MIVKTQYVAKHTDVNPGTPWKHSPFCDQVYLSEVITSLSKSRSPEQTASGRKIQAPTHVKHTLLMCYPTGYLGWLTPCCERPFM